jgi:MGT family glycosyltransferase
MARFLFSVWPLPGHLHPNIAVALALRQRGHEVAFYSGERARVSVDCEGIDLHPFRQLDEEANLALITRLGGAALALPGPLQGKRLWRQWLVDSIPGQVADLDHIVLNWKPDVLISDPSMWGAFLITRDLHNLPTAILSYTAACLLPGAEGPILGWSIPRPRSAVGRAAVSLARSVFALLSSDIPRAASRLRQSHGLPGLTMTVSEYSGTMPLYLVPSSPEFDYNRRDLPPSVRYVGPCLWDRPTNEISPEWLDPVSSETPLVYVTEGTFQLGDPFLIRAAISGLAGLPIQLVVTTGRHRNPSNLGLGPVPPSIRIESFIPQSQLFARARAVVTTGGSGTVTGALMAGIPLVIVPTAWDQPENAWSVSAAGAGIRLSVRECTPDRIRVAVQRVLSDPSYRRNAVKLGESLSRHRGANEAAEALDGLYRRMMPLAVLPSIRKDIESTS